MGGDRRKRARAALLVLYGNTCAYCTGVMTIDTRSPESATVDHVVPRALGGSNELDNLALACSKCNHDKKDLSLEAYKLTPQYKQHYACAKRRQRRALARAASA